MNVKTFNSGRMYAADGQRISYVVIPGAIIFCDHSRHIDGGMRWPVDMPEVTDKDMRTMILAAYDDPKWWDEFCAVRMEIADADFHAAMDAVKGAK